MSQPDLECESLHEFIYHVVSEICYDKDYLYLLFYRNYSTLMDEIFELGKAAESGTVIFEGNKSNINAHITWLLSGRVNFMGCSPIRLDCVYMSKSTMEKTGFETACFDLSTGEVIHGVELL